MSNAYLCPILQDSQFNNDGTFLSGGLIWFYEAGTSTPALAYTGPNADTAWTNPIVLNSRGETGGEIWLTAGQSYKIVVEGPPYYGETHGPVINTYDDISGVNDSQSVATSANWVTYPGTPVYVSVSEFSVSGDQRAIFVFGRRVRLTKSSGVAYGTVISATFALGSTTVSLSVDYGNSINSSISAVSYGFIETGAISSIPVPIYAGSSLGGSQYSLWMDYDGFNLRWARDNLASSLNWPINAATSDLADQADFATSASNGVFGTVTDVTASRAFDTTYTNSGINAKVVYVSLNTTAIGETGYATVNGSNALQWQGTAVNAAQPNMTILVPAGATYSVTNTGTAGASIALWTEQSS